MEPKTERRQNQVPIDSGWAWVVCFAYCGHKMVNGLIVRGTSIFFLEFMKKFDSSVSSTTFIPALQLFLAFFLSPIANVMAVKFGSRPVVMAGGIINAVGFIVSMFANSITYLYFSYGLITGIGLSTVTGPPALVMSQYFDKRKALAFGLTGIGMGSGSMVGAILVRYLVDTYGLQGSLLIYSGVQLHMTLLGLLYRPISFYMPKEEMNHESNSGDDASAPLGECKDYSASRRWRTKSTTSWTDAHEMLQSKEANPDTKQDGDLDEPINLLWKSRRLRSKSVVSTKSVLSNSSMASSALSAHEMLTLSIAELSNTMSAQDETDRQDIENKSSNKSKTKKKLFKTELLKNPMYWAYLSAGFFSVFGTMPVLTILTAYCQDIGITAENIALLVSLSAIPDLCFRPLIGWFSDLDLVPKIYFQIGSLAVGSVLAFVWTLCRTFETVFVVSFLAIIVLCTATTVQAPVIIDMFGLDSMPSVLGTMLFSQSFGMFLSPVLSGYIFDISRDWMPVYFLSGAFCLAATASFCAIPMYQKFTSKRKDGTNTEINGRHIH